MEPLFKIELRKERSFSEKMNGMFTYLSQNYKVIFRSLLFIVAPVSLLGGICSGLFQSRLTKMTTMDLHQNTLGRGYTGMDAIANMFQNILSPVYFIAMFLMMTGFVLVKCIVFSHMKLYTESPLKVVAFEEVFADIKSNFIKVFLSVLAVTVLIIVGYVLVILPGIYLTIALAMFVPVMIIERVGFFDALNRSFYLMRDKWWSTFGLLFITSFIVQTASFLFYLPMYVFQILRLTRVVGDQYEIWGIIASVFSSVGIMFMFSLFSLAIGMQYFNLVERREGKGLRSYIDEIGNGSQAEKTSKQVDL